MTGFATIDQALDELRAGRPVLVLDDENRKFMNESNPWALHGMAERLLEAATRGMWAEPEPATLDGLRQVLLETEGELEG